jgi:RNA recognition motif-containing protein
MNIYISNLSYGVDDNDLKELFAAFGNVSSAKVITDRYTGKSRGFGFVEMPDDTEAQQAIEKLNQAVYDGKTISVSVAKPKSEKPRRDFGGSKGGGQYGNYRQNKRW